MEIKIVIEGKYKEFEYVVREFNSGIGHESIFRNVFGDMNPFTNWYCGYVKIPNDHKYYDEHYDMMEIDCHGSLTFAGTIGELEGFYIGFDCHHYGDNPTTHNAEYCRAECIKIIDQLIE